MKTDAVWKNCFLRYIDIPPYWLNNDVLQVKPERQDIFLVECNQTQLMKMANCVIDSKHRDLIMSIKKIYMPVSPEFKFLVSREGNYVQYFPYMNVDLLGSLWKRFGVVSFDNISDLKKIGVQSEANS